MRVALLALMVVVAGCVSEAPSEPDPSVPEPSEPGPSEPGVDLPAPVDVQAYLDHACANATAIPADTSARIHLGSVGEHCFTFPQAFSRNTNSGTVATSDQGFAMIHAQWAPCQPIVGHMQYGLRHVRGNDDLSAGTYLLVSTYPDLWVTYAVGSGNAGVEVNASAQPTAWTVEYQGTEVTMDGASWNTTIDLDGHIVGGVMELDQFEAEGDTATVSVHAPDQCASTTASYTVLPTEGAPVRAGAAAHIDAPATIEFRRETSIPTPNTATLHTWSLTLSP